MKDHLNLRKRRSLRLKGYDYSQTGFYFVTLCCHQRQCLFGEIINSKIELNLLGNLVATEWLQSEAIRTEIQLDEFIVMPNHFHGIVIINRPDNNVGANGGSPLPENGGSPLPENVNSNPNISMKPKSLSSLISGFKSATTQKINRIRETPYTPVWQRNYYEHIIRDNEALEKIRIYIKNNPLSWRWDQLNHNHSPKL